MSVSKPRGLEIEPPETKPEKKKPDQWMTEDGLDTRVAALDVWARWAEAQAIIEIMSENDVEYFMVTDIVTTDTCDYCEGIAGHVYKITDATLPILPAHPNCIHDLEPITAAQAAELS